MRRQIKSRAHAGDNKQQQHKPGVDNVLKDVLIPHFRNRPDHAENLNAIEHVNHMINSHQNNGDPSDIVDVGFSHKSPTFAMILNIMIAQEF